MVRIVWRIAEKLTREEIDVLNLLKDGVERDIDDILTELGWDYAKVARILMFLENKGLIETRISKKEEIIISKKGEIYKERLLPEDFLIKMLKDKKEIKLDEIPLEKDERSAAIGILKKLGIIDIKEGRLILKKEVDLERTERFRKLELSEEEIKEFIKRGLLEKKTKQIKISRINDKGIEVLKVAKKLNLVDELTRDIIVSGRWRGLKFRMYDVESKVPKVYGGRRHFYRKILDEIIDIFVSMGFKEMEHSPIVELPLFNYDALFVPYDHPAREMQDTFYLSIFGDIREEDFFDKVRELHRKIFGSYDENMARKLLLKTHTTATTVRTMLREKKGKFFIVDRVFRNETIDWKHLIEFYQVEGIIIEEDVNLGVLIGTLKEFYRRLGFKKVRVMPSFFPYTEPSLQVMVYWNGKWLELGGAGIFRREINEVFGIEYPIAAWGLGLERLAMIKYGIDDIRLVWPRTRISQIKEYKVV